MDNPYKVLGVSRHTSLDEIKKVHRRLVRKYHPDLGGDGEKIKIINQAWELIKDKNSKEISEQQNNHYEAENKTNSNKKESANYSSNESNYYQSYSYNNFGRYKNYNRSKFKESFRWTSANSQNFKEICVCGCNGIPFSKLRKGTFDNSMYLWCAARFLRKRIGYYYDESGKRIIWITDKQRASEKRKKRARERYKANKKVREEEKARKVKQAQEAELYRIKNRIVPTSPAEAIRRNLKYYKSTPCKYGHFGLRDLKSNCLMCRKLEKFKRRSKKS